MRLFAADAKLPLPSALSDPACRALRLKVPRACTRMYRHDPE